MAIKLDKSAMVRGLADKKILVPHIERAIDEGEFEYSIEMGPKPGDDAFHPSGDCLPSLHDLYLKATGALEQKPFGVGLRKTFQVGHWWHGYLQHIVQARLGFCHENAVENRGMRGWGPADRPNPFAHIPGRSLWHPYHWATGSADIAPCQIPGKGEFVVDFKTMGAHDYRRNGLPDWCREKYIAQMNVYMEWFGIDRALIVAVLKDSPHDMKEIVIEKNDDLAAAIHQKWELVSACIDEGVAPPEDEPFDLLFEDPS